MHLNSNIRQIPVLLAVLLSLSCGKPTSSTTCEGQYLEETVQIVERLYQIGYELGMAYDPLEALAESTDEIQELADAADDLPPVCKAIFDQWSEAFSGGSLGGGGTQCMGGVCCDGTGCYD